jgi:RNA polymerase sigma factor (sigma-70 family)
MNPEACKAFAAADFSLLAIRAQQFAHRIISKYLWFGQKVTARADGVLLLGKMSADDFVIEAIEKLCDGTRKFNPSLSLETNLYGAIRSIIWANKKKADKGPQFFDQTNEQVEEGSPDPIDAIADPNCLTPEALEQARIERERLDAFAEEIETDEELSLVLMACRDGVSKPAAIAAETGIPAQQVSELKRKLRQRLDRFMVEHPIEF